MEIMLSKYKIEDLVKRYEDLGDEGVFGFDGQLNIRPPYQREFVYKDKQREEVIKTVIKGFPLNVMYWSLGDDDKYEVIDGQQRTISIGQYVNGDFAVNIDGNRQFFHNLTEEEQNKILNYELDIYICKGTEREKLNWFETINIAGEKLTQQELLNAIYNGKFISDAKIYFSKRGCVAYNIGSKYMKGTPIRQDYLATVLKWISNKKVIEYMAENQHESGKAEELWMYFQSVIDWVRDLFPKYRKEMKGIEWGLLYNEFKDYAYNSDDIEKEVARLMADEDVTNKKGIYYYIFYKDEKYLNIRAFDDRIKRKVYEDQNGICLSCNEHFEIDEMEADHIIPWSKGGKTEIENCQMLCKKCNRTKSDK